MKFEYTYTSEQIATLALQDSMFNRKGRIAMATKKAAKKGAKKAAKKSSKKK
jgi:hypothetical protein